MQKITSTAELKNAIQLLEAERAEKEKLLKEEFSSAVESFKPSNLFARSLNDITKSPYLIDNILGAGIGLVTGFYSKKLMLSPSASKLKKFLGVVLQFGVTNLVAQHQGTLRAIGTVIFRHLTRRKKMKSIQP